MKKYLLAFMLLAGCKTAQYDVHQLPLETIIPKQEYNVYIFKSGPNRIRLTGPDGLYEFGDTILIFIGSKPKL